MKAFFFVAHFFVSRRYLQQCFIYGDSLKAELVAVVVPDWEVLSKQFPGPVAEVARDPKVKEFLMVELNKTAKEYKLKGFEMARAIFVEPEPFSPENELLTPTFKVCYLCVPVACCCCLLFVACCLLFVVCWFFADVFFPACPVCGIIDVCARAAFCCMFRLTFSCA